MPRVYELYHVFCVKLPKHRGVYSAEDLGESLRAVLTLSGRAALRGRLPRWTQLDMYLGVHCTVCILLFVAAYGNEVFVLYSKRNVCYVQLK